MESSDKYVEMVAKVRGETTEDVASIHGLTFYDFKLKKELNMGILKHGYKQPSPIQEEVIPAILAGRNVVARAKNGIGKTAAFAIPLIEMCDLKDERIQTVILVPTRELAAQHQEEISALSRYIPDFVKPLLLIGGVSVADDLYRLKEKPRIIICTPGRCCDLLQRGQLRLDAVRHIVLDEADRLLCDSFRDTVNTILSLINRPEELVKGNRLGRNYFNKKSSADTIVPPDKNIRERHADSIKPQILLFSATFPQSLSNFVDSIPNCEKIVIHYKKTNKNGGDQSNDVKPPTGLMKDNKDEGEAYNQLVIVGVEHRYLLLSSEKDKVTALMWLFQNMEIRQSVIFVRSKERAERLCSVLREYVSKNYGLKDSDLKDEDESIGSTPFAVLHSGMTTDNRLNVLTYFRSGSIRHLITTDVGTRGLDSPFVNVVINFDLPDGGASDFGVQGSFGVGASKDYLHRIGRCGRFGSHGKAISFVTNDSSELRGPNDLPSDLVLLFKIERELGIEIKQITALQPIK